MADCPVIRKAVPDDLPAMMTILRACAADMTAAGIDQWDDKFPPEEYVRADLAARTAWVCLDGDKVCGMFTMDENQAAEYRYVAWQFAAERAAVIHRLAVEPKCHRRGIASQLMDFAEKEAAARGHGAIRLDTYSRNHRAVALYLGRGYAQVGQVHFRNKPAPFFCFEKPLAE
jgi:ribosomal protein S18 acetylase RimI-like enzyme